jgi:uncharacterized protein
VICGRHPTEHIAVSPKLISLRPAVCRVSKLPPCAAPLTIDRFRFFFAALSPAMNPAPTPASRQDSLIDYPCRFPIKVMGENVATFAETMAAVALQFDPQFDASSIEVRNSRSSRYLGLTITITATSREQLDDAYRAFSSHPMVKIVL